MGCCALYCAITWFCFYYLAVFSLFCMYCDALLWSVQLQRHCGESDSVITITAILHPTMQVLLLSTLFILATALAYHDPGCCINCPYRATVCYSKDSFVISRVLSPSLEPIPSLFLCANRWMWLPPRVKLNLGLSLLLLFAGDPNPIVPNLRLGTVNACSMRDKIPALSDLVVSKGIELLSLKPGQPQEKPWVIWQKWSPHGFYFLQIPRVNRRGGGVGLFVSNAFKFTPISLPPLPNPASNLYLANLNVVWLVSIFSTYIIHTVLPLLSLVSCSIYCSTWPHSLMTWYWWVISTFTLNPRQLTLDSSLIFWNLLIWISMSILLSTFMVTLLMSEIFLKGVTFCLYHRLMPFLKSILLLLIWKFLQIIVILYRQL